jgi:purine nucleosidase
MQEERMPQPDTATRIIIDCDPGIDDAMAILLAFRSPELDIAAITTVFGNTGIDHTTANALRLVEREGLAIPVARGAEQPLLRPPPAETRQDSRGDLKDATIYARPDGFGVVGYAHLV